MAENTSDKDEALAKSLSDAKGDMVAMLRHENARHESVLRVEKAFHDRRVSELESIIDLLDKRIT